MQKVKEEAMEVEGRVKTARGYKQQRDWPQLSARVKALQNENRAPGEIAVALDGERFRPPEHASVFSAGMGRRLLAEWGLRPRVSRCAGK